MQINKVDVIWNYAATFLKIAATTLLLPFILKLMPAETVGIWSVFITINALNGIFDFGFNAAFTRNLTYVFSGIQKLEVAGFSALDKNKPHTIDYGLLKGVICSMRWFYTRVSTIYFLLLSTFGTWYINTLIKNYQGSHTEVYVAWALLCVINTVNLATIYYDSLLQGRGLVKKSKQILIVSQLVYLVIAVILIYAGKGLVAVVAAQASSVIIVRWLSHKLFFTREFSQLLDKAIKTPRKEVLRAVYPNAVKLGLTTLGGVLVQRSALIIGSLYLTLEEIASYGITIQIVNLIGGLASVYTLTYQAKIVHLRVLGNIEGIKKIYIKGQYILLATFFAGGISLLVAGDWILDLINSKTKLLPPSLTLLALFLSLEQTNLSVAGNILSTKNIVPFFKASILSGFVIITGLLICFESFNAGITAMLLIPLITDFAYQSWKWPYDVIKDLKIAYTDFIKFGWHK
jgi:O-antigen/teichoic acid export membrane protein